jgi:hypothetical protein
MSKTIPAGTTIIHVYTPVLAIAKRGVQWANSKIARHRTRVALKALDDSQLADIGADEALAARQRRLPVSVRTRSYLMSLR